MVSDEKQWRRKGLRDYLSRVALIILLISLLSIFGCARTPAPLVIPDDFFEPGGNARIDDILAELGSNSLGFNTFKGIGYLRLWKSGGAPYGGRMAWAAERPDRLRVELMDLSGKPVLSWVGNRQLMQMLSISDGQFHEFRGDSLDLGRWASVPVTIEQMVTILSGKIPLILHRYRRMEEKGGEISLTLYDERLNRVQTIRSEASPLGEKSFSVWDSRGTLQYEARITGNTPSTAHPGPAFIQVTNGAGSGLSIEVSNFWPNAAVTDSLFHLQSPS